jgi:hypothetical protein
LDGKNSYDLFQEEYSTKVNKMKNKGIKIGSSSAKSTQSDSTETEKNELTADTIQK